MNYIKEFHTRVFVLRNTARFQIENQLSRGKNRYLLNVIYDKVQQQVYIQVYNQLRVRVKKFGVNI